MIETVAVTSIHEPRLYKGVALPMWVLYDRPSDLPTHMVLRLWDGMINKPTPFVFVADTYDGIKQQINAVPGRFFRMDRYENDDPKIVCVYL